MWCVKKRLQRLKQVIKVEDHYKDYNLGQLNIDMIKTFSIVVFDLLVYSSHSSYYIALTKFDVKT